MLVKVLARTLSWKTIVRVSGRKALDTITDNPVAAGAVATGLTAVVVGGVVAPKYFSVDDEPAETPAQPSAPAQPAA